jgi:metal-responsive CopG/Arc/MetJ family transcriptional regulator
LARPATADKRPTTITTMRLPDELLKRLDTRAKREGRSRSNLVERILLDGVKKREKVDGVLG